jgi:2-oxo-3-(phosphooxy)propyl 3-oxoalkanoate synthase
MLQLEAARQLSLAIMRDRHELSPSDGALLAISAKFLGFVELDLPARVHGEVRDSVLDDGASLRCAVVQDGRTQVKVDLRLGYQAECRSRPVAAAGRATHAP